MDTKRRARLVKARAGNSCNRRGSLLLGPLAKAMLFKRVLFVLRTGAMMHLLNSRRNAHKDRRTPCCFERVRGKSPPPHKFARLQTALPPAQPGAEAQTIKDIDLRCQDGHKKGRAGDTQVPARLLRSGEEAHGAMKEAHTSREASPFACAITAPHRESSRCRTARSLREIPSASAGAKAAMDALTHERLAKSELSCMEATQSWPVTVCNAARCCHRIVSHTTGQRVARAPTCAPRPQSVEHGPT